MSKIMKEEKKLSFLDWYDWEYVDDDDLDMKINSYSDFVNDTYEICGKDYSEAFYQLAQVMEQYLEYLNMKEKKEKRYGR